MRTDTTEEPNEPLTPSMALAHSIISQAVDHTAKLIGHNWPEIDRILSKERELTLSFSVGIESFKVKTKISFSEKFSDSMESEIEDPTQPSLPLNGPCHEPVKYEDADGNIIDPNAGLSSPGAEDAGTTSLGDVLDSTVAKTEQPLVAMTLDEPGWNVSGLIQAFKIAAHKAKWGKPAVSLFVDQLKAIGDNLEAIKDTIRPHTVGGQSV